MAERDSPRDKDMTVDKDREREMCDILMIPRERHPKDKTKRAKTSQTQVPKKAKVIILTEQREVACDRCSGKNQLCMPQTKGRQLLDMCMRCFRQKLSCWIDGGG